jgi:hypothetical protein
MDDDNFCGVNTVSSRDDISIDDSGSGAASLYCRNCSVNSCNNLQVLRSMDPPSTPQIRAQKTQRDADSCLHACLFCFGCFPYMAGFDCFVSFTSSIHPFLTGTLTPYTVYMIVGGETRSVKNLVMFCGPPSLPGEPTSCVSDH